MADVAQHLVAHVVQGVGRVAVARLTPRGAPDVPEAVGALVAQLSGSARPARALAALWLAEAGASQGALGHLCPSPVTRAL